MINSQEKIETCLQAALDQRSKFIVALPSDTTSISNLDTVLEDFDDKFLYLEVSSLGPQVPRWEGLEITCYFRLVQKKGGYKEMFFNFSSSIHKLSKKGSNFVQMVLERPSRLNMGQRRSSLRIDLDIQHILGFKLWEEDRFIRPQTQEQKAGLYPPKIELERIQDGSFQILDISAGGMKARVRPKLFKDLALNWNKGSTLIMWIVLDEPSARQKEEFWLKTRVKYKLEDYITKDVDMGLEFTHYGTITENKKMKWLRVRDNYLENLGNWTHKRYIELYRQGLAS